MIAAELIEQFQRDGAVCLRNLLDADAVATVRAGIDANLAQPSPRAKLVGGDGDLAGSSEDVCNWPQNADYMRCIFDGPLAEAAGRLMQSTTARLYYDRMLTLEPGRSQASPWRREQPHSNVDGRQNLCFWIPADPISRASTLEVIAGSHHAPMPHSLAQVQAQIPDIEARRADFPILGWALQPGDVVCFHMLALHSARGAANAQRRRVLSVSFLGDDITHAPRAWETYPDFPALGEELPAGEAMRHPYFPLLWRAKTPA
jgi:ectoine hydroxylase-related dioxygenase (phytanoyl-CoA dioxygenase family)